MQSRVYFIYDIEIYYYFEIQQIFLIFFFVPKSTYLKLIIANNSSTLIASLGSILHQMFFPD